MIIDTNRRVTNKLTCLGNAGVKSVIRYYARVTRQPEKELTRDEAEAITEAGLSIGVVSQGAGNSPSSFSRQKGLLDGAYARNKGAEIGQPSGSTIYFAVDYDASEGELSANIIPYFEAVAETFAPGEGLPDYDIGVYGSGLVCGTLLDRGLAARAWLSQSMGFRGSRAFKKSNRWTIAQQLPSPLCGISVDKNDLNPSQGGFGEFSSLEDVDIDEAVEPAVAASTDFNEDDFVQFVQSLGLKHFKPYELLVMGSSHSNPNSPCKGLNTRPPRDLWENIGPTIKMLDSLRARLGAPIRILNAYRSPPYNRCIGGARESQHMAFNAIDFMAEGNSRPTDWARMLRSMRDDENLFKGGVGLYASFVHLDTRGTNADW